MGTKNIIWLASYPKSGNTWFRAFLTALQNGGTVDINKMATSSIFSGKEILEQTCDVDADEFTREEIQVMQRDTFRYLSARAEQELFVKIHDAYTYDNEGNPLIPHDATRCAVYFVRNPLDVAVSFANHSNKPVQLTIEKQINNTASFLASNPTNNQFPQPLLGWSAHVKSWMDVTEFPVYMLRYEDMRTDSFRTFQDIVNRIGLEYTDDQIRTAIEASSFDALQKQEEEKGFREKMARSPRFFNKGIVGNWEQELTEEQVASIGREHREMMLRLGYQ